MRALQVVIIGVAMLSCTAIGIAQTSEPTPLSLAPTPVPAAVDAAKVQAEIAANVKGCCFVLELLKSLRKSARSS